MKNILRPFRFLFLLLLSMTPFFGHAQEAAGSEERAAITAKQFEYQNNGTLLILTGDVVIDYRGTVLRADKVTYNSETEDATAIGNVRYNDGTRMWNGEKLSGNFATKQWDFGLLTTFYDPFYIISENSQQVEEGHWVSRNPIITTCDPNDKEFYVTARLADVYSEQLVRMEGVKFVLNDIPILYLPVYTFDLQRENTNFDFLPGYSSRHGAYALMAYSMELNENMYTTTHLDLRSKRGIAVGQSLTWFDRANSTWEGKAQAYYAQDSEPYTSPEKEILEREAGINIDKERYRLRLSHVQTLGPSDSLFVELNHLSDREVIKDFFDDEFRLMPEPENRISYIYTDSIIQAGAEVQANLNEEDFGAGTRLPELRLQVSPVRIGDTDLFYESFSSAGFYEQTFSDFDKEIRGRENYDSTRIHTQHILTMPKKYMGWLNFTPRAGYYGTFYGDTPGTEFFTTNIVNTVSTNGVITAASTNVTSFVEDGDAELRNLLELGFETSFKAFKTLHDGPIGQNGSGLRHVVEPSLRYTLIPDADPTPAELYQFDSIDRLDDRNDIRLGLRNKWQTRVRQNSEDGESWSVRDLVDVELFTTYRLDPDEGEDDFEPFGIDAELRLTESTFVDIRGFYDSELGEVSRVNTTIGYRPEGDGYLAVEHAYVNERTNVLQADWQMPLNHRYGLEGYSRYEIEDGEMEEQMFMVTKKTDCVGYGVGLRWIAGDVIAGTDVQDDDSWRVWFQVWLLAFPNSEVNLGGQ